MLAIGRALMSNPGLLLMDEPTEGLAPLLVREVARVIGELKREGLCILLVEQNLPMAASVADRVHVLNRGAIVYSGTPADLLANPRHRVRDDVTGLPARLAAADFAHEALDHAGALERVGDLRVELHAIEPS